MMSVHKHNYVIKTTNRLEYWFTCDNCGKDIMISKWDFWDLRHYEKQALAHQESFDAFIKEQELKNKFWRDITANEVVFTPVPTFWQRFIRLFTQR